MMTESLLDYFENKVMCASFCKLIRINQKFLSPFFMKYFLKLYYSTDLVGIFQVQSTGISNYQFESFLSFQKMLVPSSDLVEKFDQVVIPLVTRMDKLALAKVSLKESRDLLLSRLISGKLPVDDLDIRFPPSMAEAEEPAHG